MDTGFKFRQSEVKVPGIELCLAKGSNGGAPIPPTRSSSPMSSGISYRFTSPISLRDHAHGLKIITGLNRTPPPEARENPLSPAPSPLPASNGVVTDPP